MLHIKQKIAYKLILTDTITHTHIHKIIIIKLGRGHRGVMVKAMDCGIV